MRQIDLVNGLIDRVAALSVELAEARRREVQAAEHAAKMEDAMPLRSAVGVEALLKFAADHDPRSGNSRCIHMIKEVRWLTGLGLKEAKDLVERCGFNSAQDYEP